MLDGRHHTGVIAADRRELVVWRLGHQGANPDHRRRGHTGRTSASRIRRDPASTPPSRGAKRRACFLSRKARLALQPFPLLFVPVSKEGVGLDLVLVVGRGKEDWWGYLECG